MKRSTSAGAALQAPAPKALHAYQSFIRQHELRDDARAETLYQVYHDLQRIRKWSNLRVSHRAMRPYIAGSAAATFDSVHAAAADGDGGDQRDDEGRRGGAQSGDASVRDRTQAVVPVGADEWLTGGEMYQLCAQCVHPESGEALRCVTVAIVDDDSTTAYYRMTNRWEEIVHPQWKSKKASTEPTGGGAARGDAQDGMQSGEERLSTASDSDA